jgi:hypothetical protein
MNEGKGKDAAAPRKRNSWVASVQERPCNPGCRGDILNGVIPSASHEPSGRCVALGRLRCSCEGNHRRLPPSRRATWPMAHSPGIILRRIPWSDYPIYCAGWRKLSWPVQNEVHIRSNATGGYLNSNGSWSAVRSGAHDFLTVSTANKWCATHQLLDVEIVVVRESLICLRVPVHDGAVA